MGRRLRIAVVAACPFPARRGTPVRVQRLSEALAARGHRVVVFTYPLGDGSPVGPVVVRRAAGLPGYRFLGPGPTAGKLLGLDWLLAHEVRRGLRRERFDLIHAHHYEGLVVALLARPAGLPIAYDAHTLLETELPSYPLLAVPRGTRRRVGRELDRRLPSRADLVVAVSRRIADRLVDDGRVERERVCVATNGVEAAFFAVPRRAIGHVCGGAPPRVVFAGNLGPYQGIDHLVDGFAMVGAQIPGARLELITDDDARPLVARLARLGLADRVDVTPGDLEELPTRLARADVAVNPRPAGDGVPQKLLNYMAAGLPIVSFAGTAFELRHEETGLVVPDGDPAALAQAILRCLRDPPLAACVGAAARREAQRSYSWAGSAAVLEEAFDRLAGTRR
jgi:glycosyltransferase involved in cell wall biosynthesis